MKFKSKYKSISKRNPMLRFLGLFISLLALSNFAWAGAYTYSDLYVPSGIYTTGTNGQLKGGLIQDSDNVLWTLAPGASLKLEVVIPPGVSSFGATVQMNTWLYSGGSTGEFLYGHSLSDPATTESPALGTSTGYTFAFVNSTGGLRTTPTVSEGRGYLLFHNTSSNWNMLVTAFSLSMVISDATAYNAWVPSAPAPQGNVNGGTGGSSSSTSTTSSTSGSTGTTSTSGGCGGLLGPCDGGTTTSSSGDTSTTSSGDTSTTSSSGDSSSGGSGTLSITGTAFQAGMAGIGFVGGIYTEDDNFVYWDLGNNYDFGDGEGSVPTRMKFRVNKQELATFIGSGKTFDTFVQQHGMDPVNAYYFWSVHADGDDPANALFLYPDVGAEEDLVKRLLEFTNVIHAGVSPHGVVYVVTDDNRLHRGILNHHMIPVTESAPAGTVVFDAVSDLNGDGFNDYSILYDNGFKQYLYYKTQL